MTPAALPSGPASVAALVDEAAQRPPGVEALVDARRRLSYGDLRDAVDGVAAGLAQRGLERGDVLAVSLPNSVDAVLAFLAACRLGAVYVGVHPGLAPVEKANLLADSGAALLVTTDALAAALAHVAAEVLQIDLADGGIADLARPSDRSLGVVDPFAPAAYAYTSGTTGFPKGVVHDQHHMLLPAGVILHHRLGGRGERVGVHLPLTTLNVLILGPVLALLGGGTCVCIDGHAPGLLADVISRERVEHLSTSPAVVHDLLADPAIDPEHLRGLRLGVGGVSCPESLRDAYRLAVGRAFTTGYGLTEAPTSVTQETERVAHRAGASGVAMAHVHVEIVDDDGRVLPSGESGHITVLPAGHGPWAGTWRGLHGYHQRPEATAAVRRGQRLFTGDTGWMDADGYLYVADRTSELINRGGSKVSPAEVERVLREHPAVADCIVLGRPDERLGATVGAVVQVRPGVSVDAATLAEHCARSLARYKVPSTFALVEQLPRNPMGKVVRGAALQLLQDT